MNEKLLIDASLAQAIIDYLKSKPYIEVAGLIGEILKCQPAEAVGGLKATDKKES